MALLKDNEREQLRQLVKACLLEISKLKIELKRCQDESKSSGKVDQKLIDEKDREIEKLEGTLEEKNEEISKLEDLLDKTSGKNNQEIKKLEFDLEEKDKKISELVDLLDKTSGENNQERFELALKEKDKEISELTDLLDQKNAELDDLEKIKRHFDALTARPKKDLTSFQSQVYQLLNTDKCNTEELYAQIIDIGFKELSFDNFNSILRNLERKGYFKSFRGNGSILWQKIEK